MIWITAFRNSYLYHTAVTRYRLQKTYVKVAFKALALLRRIVN